MKKSPTKAKKALTNSKLNEKNFHNLFSIQNYIVNRLSSISWLVCLSARLSFVLPSLPMPTESRKGQWLLGAVSEAASVTVTFLSKQKTAECFI